MRPTVLLFDVDGTLITTGGVGRRAIEAAFGQAYGRPDACREIAFGGMTDRAIVRSGLSAIGVPATDSEIASFLELYLEMLGEQVAAADIARYRVHEGMQEAISEGHALGMAVGLGTGNVREGARLKLEKVGLFHRFSFGGFGDDSEDRDELIRRGAQRGAAQLGCPLEHCRVVVIGDTPKDVRSAMAIGATCVAVGTGTFTVSQLREAGATSVFESLAAPGALEAVLFERSP